MSMRHVGNNSATSTSWVLKCTDLPQFDALMAQADRFGSDDKLHLRNLCNDSARCTGLVTIHRSPGQRSMILDYSRQRITGETMELLFDLADAVKMTERREAMRTGCRINATEDRPVLHHVLRMPADYPLVLQEQKQQTNVHPLAADENNHNQQEMEDGPALLDHIHQVRQQIEQMSKKIRSGDYRSVTGEVFDTILCIGVTEPAFVSEALEATNHSSCAKWRLRCMNNVDPVDFWKITHDLNPATTLAIVVSPNFVSTETMLMARTVQHWFLQHLVVSSSSTDKNESTIRKDQVVATHMFAVTDNPMRCQQFGIAKEHTFPYFTQCGRYSLCGPVGVLPLSIQFGYDVVCEFLNGAHAMDQHFFHSPLYDNIPVILGLLGVWNSTFLGYSCRAILPYAQALSLFPAYVQKIDMESNGKRVALDGTPLLHKSGEIDIGMPGTAAQHSWFQLLHQGREIPADFIGFMESPQPIDLPGEAVSNHDELMSHFFAQPDALAYGKTLVDLMQEGTPEPLREHKHFPGNRPSSTLLLSRLDAYAVGQLVALYEHRTAVQGFIWGMNSFDQFGNDLSLSLSKQVRAQLSASRKTGASVQGFNVSTSRLLEHYLAARKRTVETATTTTY
jgi:glucose-6-phosphate isomerase